MAKGTKYSQEFKEDAVRYRLEHPERALRKCAENLGISESALKNWMKSAKIHEGAVPTRGSGNYASDEAKEIARLQRELRDTKDALEVLRISKALIEKMLKKWTLETRDESGQRILYPRKIEQCLQGHLYYEPKQTMCYLIQGDWYCLDIKYLEQLNTEFADAYDKNKAREEALKDKYKLKSDKKTEDAYNKSFYNRTDVIVGHTALIAKYEIADMFFWDDENLYLMCNKGKFDGSGSRDLTNQIYASAHYMQKMLMSHRRNEFLKELYESIESVYASKKKTLPISFDEFSWLFTKRLCYVAGYLFGYRKESNSYYAKYLTIDLLKKMQQMGFDCVVMDVEGKRG